MLQLEFKNNRYVSPESSKTLLSRYFPSFFFYYHLIGIVIRCGRLAKHGRYSDELWGDSSLEVLQRLEQAGIKFEISGVENITDLNSPVVFIGNHMSMMETMILPIIILPKTPVTFVIKESLLAYPVFKHVMKSRNPIAVSRSNPRQDLKIVLEQGVARLRDGMSVIVFPQTTRSHLFDAKQMSSIGVKLAKKAGVPVVPVALKTDCWQNGVWFKDLGRLDSNKTAHYSFAKPITVIGKGEEEQDRVNKFIEESLIKWGGNIVRPEP